MKTRRLGSSRCWNFFHCWRRLAIFGRSCSAGRTLFFEGQALVMGKGPYRAVIDLDPACRQLGNQTSQGEVCLGPFQQPVTVCSRQSAWLVSADLARSGTARLAKPPNPLDRAAMRHPKMCRRRSSRHPASLNRQNHALAQIHRIGSDHACWPPIPASSLNQKTSALGIPYRVNPISSRSSRSWMGVMWPKALCRDESAPPPNFG